MKRWLGYTVSLVVTVVALELISALAMHAGWIPGSTPTYRLPRKEDSRFWVDLSVNFGVWHNSNTVYRHKSACFDVLLESNSYGAVDRERSRSSDASRVVVLGDSFVEGFGVEEEFRFTNLLEAQTGREFLNFGTSGHFGPTQYWKLYESMASKFDHDEVWIMLLPDNDFLDDYPRFQRYQPYLEGEYPNYELKYTLDSPLKSSNGPRQIGGWTYLREFSYFLNVLRYVKYILSENSEETRGSEERPENYSGYSDYSEEELMRLTYVLEQIKKISGGRKMRVFTLPRLNDFYAAREGKKMSLPQPMQRISGDVGFEFFDLFPGMDTTYQDQWEQMFHECDGHWSEEGHRVAAEIMRMETEESVQ